ncbi:potassium-transporting ATPase C chain [Renibacterium salmoninarum ATCC 33209]|uniref:Potassium-transporting ATPase KdpC subunit n=1 Tax=Renibacterium salmoninarum (strain ATCC 33209 / DSM 20767 / JCM 11484 / NBRC 15589 / NCIMB 2235) TaxID=288705 RepID=A9WQL6_RENSM|nr:potassium-transporting ATPase subunit KdpC [Renibacterium salmoninarum]ABY22658.1 potassium-transporting ATPase C chain [Renibacterium salmoninarum ATCC 33209]
MNTFTSYLRQFGTAFRLLIAATVVLGLGYPAVVWGIGQLAFPNQANGSIVSVNGQQAASSLIAQSPKDGLGPEWFHPRPSAVNWDPASSRASNLGPNDPKLAESIETLRAQIAEDENVSESKVPMDALTASGSGLDPQISLAYAQLQIPRIADKTGLSETALQDLVSKNTTSELESLLGQQSVNVTKLNIDLAAAVKK